MKRQHLQCLFILCILLLLVSCSQNTNVIGRDSDPFPDIEIPVISNAFNICRYVNMPKGTKSVNYNLKLAYPATDVFSFYRYQFEKNGWVLVGGMKGEEVHWETFIDGTQKGMPSVRQFLALWRDSTNKKEFILALKYQRDRNEEWNDELLVSCQIHFYIDIREINDFFSRIESSGEYPKLMEMLDNYRMSDGEIDFERASKENPENKLLFEYWTLTKKAYEKMGR